MRSRWGEEERERHPIKWIQASLHKNDGLYGIVCLLVELPRGQDQDVDILFIDIESEMIDAIWSQ